MTTKTQNALHESYVGVSMALGFGAIEPTYDAIADQFFDLADKLGYVFPPHCKESDRYIQRLYRECGLV